MSIVARLRQSLSPQQSRQKVEALLARCEGRVHIGCNTVKITGYVNVDVRPTSATDLVHDCRDVAIFPSASLKVVYSNAFFEHVYVMDRLPLLEDIRRALAVDGRLIFTGLPDFEGVARAYLERRKPGHVSPAFDLFEAYRYTHGDPEGRQDWWLAQLHKGLLDAQTMEKLLRDAGFAASTVFSYRWGTEPHAVTLGCIAQRSARAALMTPAEIRDAIGDLPSNVAYESLVVAAGHSS